MNFLASSGEKFDSYEKVFVNQMPKTSIKGVNNLDQILLKFDNKSVARSKASSMKKSKRSRIGSIIDSPDYIFSPQSRADSPLIVGEKNIFLKSQKMGKSQLSGFNKTQNFNKLSTLYNHHDKANDRIFKPLDLGNERRYYFKRQNLK